MKRYILPILPSLFLLLQHPAAAADWYVRLTVTAPDDAPPVRVDSGNVFGRLHDSVDGLDSHDLGEMPPPEGSMGDRYLSIVFPHPEWNGEFENYATDYRAAVTNETQGDSWKFEVRTRTTGIRTVVSWAEGTGNPIAILPRSRIKDAASGAILVADTSQTTSFTISSTEAVNSYVWEYLGQEGPPVTPGHLPPGVGLLLNK